MFHFFQPPFQQNLRPVPLRPSAQLFQVEDPSQLEKQKTIQALTVWEGVLPRFFF